MINSITTTSIPSKQISLEVSKIEQVLEAHEKKDLDNKRKELMNLLIEYIIANSKGDTAGAKDISGQMTKVLNSIGKEVEDVNQIKTELQSILDNPKDANSSTMAALQGILSQLEHASELNPEKLESFEAVLSKLEGTSKG